MQTAFDTAYRHYLQGDYQQAELVCRDHLKKFPQNSNCLHLLAVLAHRQNRQSEGLDIIQKALSLAPQQAELHYTYSMMLLLNGDFAKGWDEYEWRLKVEGFKHKQLASLRWQGQTYKDKTLLVLPEQGFGDTIQFMRYLPLLKQRMGKVIYACPSPLLDLARTIPNIDLVSDSISTTTKFDLYTSLLSLPRLFRTNLDNLPPPADFFVIDAQHQQMWAEKLNTDNFKIGIVWAGRRSHENDRNRSCMLNDFAPLAHIPGITFYSLQKELAGEDAASTEAEQPPEGMQVISLGQDIKDFSDTAAIINQLDLVIAVDTAVVHLAATLGKETWVMLPLVPDWRWLLERDNSPWYPSVYLFRQTQLADWSEPFARAAERLRERKA